MDVAAALDPPLILHVGVNNRVNESSKAVLGKLLNLKKFIENTLPVIKINEHLHGLQMDIIDNGSITSNKLNKGGLHLNSRGLGKLFINFIRRIKKFATT